MVLANTAVAEKVSAAAISVFVILFMVVSFLSRVLLFSVVDCFVKGAASTAPDFLFGFGQFFAFP